MGPLPEYGGLPGLVVGCAGRYDGARRLGVPDAKQDVAVLLKMESWSANPTIAGLAPTWDMPGHPLPIRTSSTIAPTMNRSDLALQLAHQFPQLLARDVEHSVDVLLKALSEALTTGGRVEVRGFGSFTITTHAARIGRNPKNGVSVSVPGKRRPRFKPGKALRERVLVELPL